MRAKSGLVPDCDVHGEPMYLAECPGSVFGIANRDIHVWRCAREDCDRYFYGTVGYRYTMEANGTAQAPRCASEGAFLVAQQSLGLYVCPVDGCNTIRPWMPREQTSICEGKNRGKVVAAMASVHAPQLFTRPPEEDPRQLDAGIAAMQELGKVLDRTRPDALIIFASDHMETFFLRAVPTFAIMAGDRATAAFAGRTWGPAIHQPLAEALLEQLVRRDVDMAYSQDADLGHSFAAIFEWILEDRAIPVVPVLVNTYLPPLPSPRRCAALGRAIADCGEAPGTRGGAGKRRHVALSGHGSVL